MHSLNNKKRLKDLSLYYINIMAYGKKQQKPFYRKKKFIKGAKNAISIATSALRTASLVKSLINVEYKYVDNYNATAVIPGTYGTVGDVILQTGITQGDSVNQRNGNSVKLKSVYIRGLFSLDTTVLPHTDIRLMVIKDLEGVYSSGTAISPSDILQIPNYFLSPININNGKRFKVLYDRTISLDASNPSRMFKIFMKSNQHLRFTGPTNTATDEGHYYLCAFVDSSTTAATTALTWNYNTRIRYLDN